MDIDYIFNSISCVISDQFDVLESKVFLTSLLEEDFGSDSLSMIELVMTLEEVFHIDIDDSSVQNINTVFDVVSLVKNNLDI